VKNDVRDAADLADLLRMGRLPEAWIAPPAVRELRELVRHRDKLVVVRSGFIGIGPVWAAVFVAEIGDVTRFVSARHLCSWAGLTPRHRESDTTVHRGAITKMGSTLVRWAAVEAVQRIPDSAGWLVATRADITVRRGRNIATVAVARRLLTLVYYGLRDGHIRALTPTEAKAAHDTAGAA
jgi:transposase